jgi:hypothetical protein
MHTYDWTVMLFVSSDNGLHPHGEEVLRKMREVGTSDRVAVVLQLDTAEEGRPTERHFLNDSRVDLLGETSGGDPQTILEFVWAATQRYPSTKQALIFWDHANGWQDHATLQERRTAPSRRIMGHDDHPYDDLSIEEMRSLAKQLPLLLGKQLDVIGFDACLMSMVEVAYQFRGSTPLIVASQEVLPAQPGWPYDAILRKLLAYPSVSGEQLAADIVTAFRDAYRDRDAQVTLAAVGLDGVGRLLDPLSDLSCRLMDVFQSEGRKRIDRARGFAQSFRSTAGFIDLRHFCEQVVRQFGDEPVGQAARSVLSVDGVIKTSTATAGAEVGHANGLSITFPMTPIPLRYSMLDFSSDCRWVNFLHAYSGLLTDPPQ